MQAKTKSPDEYCRICGMVLSCNRVHIFQMEPITRKKIFKLMPFKISKDDGLPQDCCNKCNDTLKHFITFVDRSWYIQKTFLRTVYKDDHESNKHAGIHLPREWYCDSSEDQDTSKKENQNKLSEEQESESDSNKEDKAKEKDEESKNEVHEKQDKAKETDEKSTSENKLHEKKDKAKENIEDSKHESDSEGSIHRKESTESIQRKESTESIQKDSAQLSEESDTTTTTNTSSQFLHGKEKYKRSSKWKRANPFCDRRPMKRKKRHEKKRKANVEENTENSIATSKRSRNPRSRGLCQLVDNGKVTFVQRPSTLKCPNFIMSRIPNFGLIYCCKKCAVIYTTEEAAENHDCDEPFTTTSTNKDELSEPPYVCEICNMSFLRRVKLEHHLFSHMEGFESDASDEEPPKRRKVRRQSSESSVDIKLKSYRTSSESEGSFIASSVNSDTFIVPDNFVEYE